MGILDRILRAGEGKKVKALEGIVPDVNAFEAEISALSDDALKAKTDEFRQRLDNGADLDDLLIEAFAVCREAARRTIGQRHYDVQLMGGAALHFGWVAEMKTGEGKTLVSTLPAYLNGLTGKGVHLVTVNDYLARRDAEWMGQIHRWLGLTVGLIIPGHRHSPAEKRVSYESDITYATNNEMGFDYLRDNMAQTKGDKVQQRGRNYCIVDEVDSILIDEARTPLIISGRVGDAAKLYYRFASIVRGLERDVDYEVEEDKRVVVPLEAGIDSVERALEVENIYDDVQANLVHQFTVALKAKELYKRDKDYIVQGGEVKIVDEFTGRILEGRRWSEGIHQAVEAKEGVKIKEESQTLATITLQNFFKLYKKLGGMTGTAMTESEEFLKIYELDVVAIPTNRPMQRVNFPDNIYGTEKEKWDAVIQEIIEVHGTGRPVLVGTTSIELSEMLSHRLVRKGVPHNVLNAKFHEREAEIVAQAGRKSGVTIATNMAGRGTDIILGGNPEHAAWEELKATYSSRLDVPKSEWDGLTKKIAEREGMVAESKAVMEIGGLHVVGTERHDSRRIDLQLRGRAGRQGDPGSSRFFISLDDKLMRLFAGDAVKRIMQWAGLKEGEPIVSSMVTRRIEGAQKKREEQHFDQRKNLLEYDEVMDEQRKRTYSYRQQILDGVDCRGLLLGMINDEIERWATQFLAKDYRWETIVGWVTQNLNLEIEPSDVRDLARPELEQYLRDEGERQGEVLIYEQIDVDLPEDADSKLDWNWMALSKWANRFFGLSLQDKDLRKFDREALGPALLAMAREGMARRDYAPLNEFLDPHFPNKSLSGWANFNFLLGIKAEELIGKEKPEIVKLLQERVRARYDEKEITFPVSVGMHNFLAGDGKENERFNREKLARWANTRFRTEFVPEQFSELLSTQIHETLVTASRQFLGRRPDKEKVEARLNEILGPDSEETNLISEKQIQELTKWVDAEHGLSLNEANLKKMNPSQVRIELLQGIEQVFRPEMRQTERSVLLEFLDTAWKDHLYFMGHLKQGIGFVGYAQKDPRTEYKREGRRAFLAMWDRVAEQVTQAVFRIEHESPAFVGSLWRITATEHDVAAPLPVESKVDQLQTNAPEAGEEGKTIAPIVNDTPRVGRNDDCPCGSGKKYKKCCGK